MAEPAQLPQDGSQAVHSLEPVFWNVLSGQVDEHVPFVR